MKALRETERFKKKEELDMKKMFLEFGSAGTIVAESERPNVSDEFLDAFNETISDETKMTIKWGKTETRFEFEGPAWRIDVLDSETGEVLAAQSGVDSFFLWKFAVGLMSRDEEAETYYRRLDVAAETAYELYKEDWKRRMLTQKDLLAAKAEWFEALEEFGYDEFEYPFSDFEEEQGYGGSLYVCFEEFCGAEFQDDGYLEELLGKDSELLKQVLEYRRARFGK